MNYWLRSICLPDRLMCCSNGAEPVRAAAAVAAEAHHVAHRQAAHAHASCDEYSEPYGFPGVNDVSVLCGSLNQLEVLELHGQPLLTELPPAIITLCRSVAACS